jgi:hypothetical protein
MVLESGNIYIGQAYQSAVDVSNEIVIGQGVGSGANTCTINASAGLICAAPLTAKRISFGPDSGSGTTTLNFNTSWIVTVNSVSSINGGGNYSAVFIISIDAGGYFQQNVIINRNGGVNLSYSGNTLTVGIAGLYAGYGGVYVNLQRLA